MESILYNATIIALSAVVWIQMMVSPGNLLDGVAKWINNKWTKRWPKVHFMLFQCEKCFAGQLALWFVIIVMSREIGGLQLLYNAFILIMLSIFMARVIGGVVKRYC